jgi:hypothetical protein
MVKRSYWLGGFFALIVLIVIVDSAKDWIVVSYQFDVWRMDLDDFVANVGIFLAGVAAVWTVKLRNDETRRKLDALEHKLNGEVKQAAHDHLQENEIIATMNHRLDKMEVQRDECTDALSKLRSRIDAL